MRRVLLAVLSLILLIGLAMSEDLLKEKSKEVRFNFEDSVNGEGYFASNDKIVAQGPHTDARMQGKYIYSCSGVSKCEHRLADMYLQKMDHGSGLIEKETIITSTVSNTTQADPDIIYAYALIVGSENSIMAYKPITMSIDTGYYASFPISFKSLLGEMTAIKNYASETSMVQETKYARAINKDLLAIVEDDYSGWNPSMGLARSVMNLNESVSSGIANVGMLQGRIDTLDSDKTAWHKPDVNIEEDYTGTFNIAIKMNMTLPVYKTVSEDSWLPCCYSGWNDLLKSDRKGFGTDAKGIFDCTCPKRYTQAQGV